MSKLVLLFSCDPGGSNTIIPLINPLKQKGYKVRLFGRDTAIERYKFFNLKGLDISDFFTETNLKNVELFLKKEKPDFVITGTSAEDLTEKFLWKAAEKLKIPSFAILDHWSNYGIRFSPYRVSQLGQYNHNKSHPYLPNKILVMDDYAKNKMIREGFDQSRLIVTGQPYFELLDQLKNKPSKIKNIRKNLNISYSDFVIVYASEPTFKSYSGEYFGYSGKEILMDLHSSLKKITYFYNKKITLIIKLHPREKRDKYLNIINNLKKDAVNMDIIVDRDSDPWDLILESDLVCGMTSMFLIEAVLLNKPIMSIQIGLKKKEPFILVKKGIIKSILDKKTLFNELKTVIVKHKLPQYNFNVIKNPIENVIYQMEKYL